ncbi:hypothetical protein DFH29DRAFT_79291 [Suillus ampliporus]|nr:hypothetical protein DFH29DRAFT_79291 [Suillus ampliporus]
MLIYTYCRFFWMANTWFVMAVSVRFFLFSSSDPTLLSDGTPWKRPSSRTPPLPSRRATTLTHVRYPSLTFFSSLYGILTGFSSSLLTRACFRCILLFVVLCIVCICAVYR